MDSVRFVDDSTVIVGSDANVSLALFNIATGHKYQQINFEVSESVKKQLFNVCTLHADSHTLLVGSSVEPALYSFHYALPPRADTASSTETLITSKANAYASDALAFGLC